MLTYSNIKQIVLLASVIFLTACNGGGSDSASGDKKSDKPPVEDISTRVSGQVFKGPVAYATVTAFDADGNALASTVTDDQGFYTLSLDASYRGVVQIDATGGDYINEATGMRTPLTETLRSVKVLTEKDSVMNVTLLTEMAVRELPFLVPELVVAANRKVAEAMQLDLDIVSEAPVDLLDEANVGETGGRVDYALVIAGMTKAAEAEDIKLSHLMFELNQDIADNSKLDDELQLTRLNKGINAFLDSAQNKVAVNKAQHYRNTYPVVAPLDMLSVYANHQLRIAPDITDDKGQLFYHWRQVMGPAALMDGADTEAMTVKAAETVKKQTLAFELTVTDSGGLSVSQTYYVRVLPIPVISGVVFKGPIQGARVKITQVDGTLIGETTTASDGRYQVRNSNAYQGLVIAEVTGGTYVSEATGQTVSLEQTLRAVKNMKATITSLNITPFTELAFRRAKHLGETLDVSKVEQAALDVSRAFGVYGLVNNEPLNLMDPSSKFERYSSESDYALALAAAMVAMHTHSQSLTDWLDRVSEDLSDNGKIDDIETLNALYRGVYSFIKSPQNKAKITEYDSIVGRSFYRSTPPEILSISSSDGYERAQINVLVQAQDTGIGGIRFYSLQQLSGPAAKFTVKQSRNSFRIGLPELNGDLAETLTFEVTVSDSDELTASEIFSIEVQPYPNAVLDKIIDPQLRQCIESHSPKVRDIGDLRSLQCGPEYAGISQLDGMEQFAYLINFIVKAQNQITDVTPLASLPNLRSLAIEQTVMTDLTAFTVLKLGQLSLKNSPLLTDFSALPQLAELYTGNFYGTGLTDGHIFQQLPGLSNINIGKTQIENFSFLQENERIRSLGISDLGLTDITLLGLEHQSNLYRLDLSGNPLIDISQLAALTQLDRLNLSGTKVSDLSSLGTLKGMVTLDVSHTKVADLSPLASLTRLSTIDVSHTEVTDLSVFRRFKSVSEISLQAFKGTDISPVIEMKRSQPARYLKKVDLTGAVHVPCSQMTELRGLGVYIAVEVQPGVTCTAD
ncbi:hypothetical protein KCG43_04110 [Photobacterium sp. WH24]|uniref:hypothetical protein n=1 Tax=Photobacterium sp. WH24 TaxID=2827237 RepID=UPI001C47E40D|nr:hypothetical protein [Photobacterium sp. WH24]MBV7261208.1 hypothetical protein [Photobacterium sp. WH24]